MYPTKEDYDRGTVAGEKIKQLLQKKITEATLGDLAQLLLLIKNKEGYLLNFFQGILQNY